MEEHTILCVVRTESSYVIGINFSRVVSQARLCEISGGQNGRKLEEVAGGWKTLHILYLLQT
jgi:hypothetical protein